MDSEGGIKINDVLVDPTGDYVKNYLFNLGKETPFLDYKKKISTDKDSEVFQIV